MSVKKIESPGAIDRTASPLGSPMMKPARIKLPFRSFTEPKPQTKGLEGRVTLNQDSYKTPLKTPIKSPVEDWAGCVSPSPEKEDEEGLSFEANEIETLVETIDHFMHVCFSLSEKQTDETENLFKLQFTELNLSTQMLIRHCIGEIIRENQPVLASRLDEMIDTIIDNPFLEMANVANKKVDVTVMPAAIVKARQVAEIFKSVYDSFDTPADASPAVSKSLNFLSEKA